MFDCLPVICNSAGSDAVNSRYVGSQSYLTSAAIEWLSLRWRRTFKEGLNCMVPRSMDGCALCWLSTPYMPCEALF